MSMTLQELTDELASLPEDVVETFKKVKTVMFFGMPLTLDNHEMFYTPEGLQRQVEAFTREAGAVYTLGPDGEIKSTPIDTKSPSEDNGPEGELCISPSGELPV